MTIYKIGELVEIERVHSVDDGWQASVKALIGVQGRVLSAVCSRAGDKAVTRYRLDGVGSWIRHECLQSFGAPTADEVSYATKAAVEQGLFQSEADVLTAWAEAEVRSNNAGYLVKSKPEPVVEHCPHCGAVIDDDDDDEEDDAEDDCDFDF